MEKDISKEIEELNKRLNELEKIISVIMGPLQNVEKITRNYLRIAGLLLENGGLTPDTLIPEIKDNISKEIVRALINKSDSNISQITEMVRSKRGTASRRIIRQRIQDLSKKNIIQKKQKGSMIVYSLTDDIIKRWSKILGFT